MQKVTLIAIFVCAFVLIDAQDKKIDNLEEKVFNQWLKRNKIDVPPNADLKTWKANVIAKFKEAEAHNAKYRKGEVKFKKAINHLSHLTDAERKATLFGYLVPTQPLQTIQKVDPSVLKDLPDYWNWADKGVVHAAPNQGQCNDCYVMAGIASVEAHSCIFKGACEKLSEQEAVECTADKCNPGYFYEAFNYTITAGGAALNKDYPYQGKVVNPCDTTTRKRVDGTQVASWKSMPNDEPTIRFYLYTYGPMYVGFKAYPNLDHYKEGIYTDTENGSPAYGHAVLLVGYGTENGIDYWILRNSWGPNWGDNGYFKMQRGINLAECESGWPTYPIMK